jgi:hypothetical protein
MEAGKFSFKFSRQSQKNLVGSSKYAYFSILLFKKKKCFVCLKKRPAWCLKSKARQSRRLPSVMEAANQGGRQVLWSPSFRPINALINQRPKMLVVLSTSPWPQWSQNKRPQA